MNIFKLYKESNRQLHFKYGILVGLVLTILGGVGCAYGLEFKDKQNKEINGIGEGFDWIDFWFTVAGAFVGQIVQLIIIIPIIYFLF